MNSGLYALVTAQREGQAALPYLEDIVRAAARLMRTRLVNQASADLRVSYPPSKVLSLRKLLDEPSFRDSTIYALLRIRKSLPPGVVIIEGRLVSRFIGLQLGEQDPSTSIVNRDVTDLEMKVAERMLRELLGGMATALAGNADTEIKPERFGTHRKVLDGIPLDMIMLAVPIDMGPIDGIYGTMTIAIPAQAGHEFLSVPVARPQRERASSGRLLQQALPVQVEVVAELARFNFTVGRLKRLHVGDILPLRSPPTAVLRVNDHQILEVEAGQSGGRHSVRVVKKLSE